MPRSRRGGLSFEVRAEIALHSAADNAAIEVVRQPDRRAGAVARMSLIAPGRPDIVDRVLELAHRRANPNYRPSVDWPPGAVVVDLLTATREVTTGQAGLVGPGGIRVEQIPGDHGPSPRPAQLRVLRDGAPLATVRTVEDLTRYLPIDELTLDENNPE